MRAALDHGVFDTRRCCLCGSPSPGAMLQHLGAAASQDIAYLGNGVLLRDC